MPRPLLNRFNELEVRWAAWDNWTFSLEFEAPQALARHAAVLLELGGLDTGARTISLPTERRRQPQKCIGAAHC